MTTSLRELLLSLPPTKRKQVLASLTNEERIALHHDWRGFWARPDQLAPPGEWATWLIQAGRGWGKTRTGAQQVIEWAREPGIRIALVGRTAADVRDVMVQGESGILACSHPAFMPVYLPSKRELAWPNGTIAKTYSAEKPNQLRGPQHHKAWPDELAAWQYADAWDQLQFGLRLGKNPQSVITTTPRPTKLIRGILKDASTVVTRGKTYDNRANLAATFFSKIISKYEGTRLGRQELDGDLLEDTPGALWTQALLERCRAPREQDSEGVYRDVLPDFRRVVVAVDPSVGERDQHSSASDEDSKADRGLDECGIVVVALGTDGKAYVLADYSGQYNPVEWAAKVVRACIIHKATDIVAEVNNGGALVKVNIEAFARDLKDSDNRRQRIPPVTMVHASKGKRARAEPIATHYEAGRILHIGTHAKLEDQQCTWDASTSTKSPGRIDALVWGATSLLEGSGLGLIRATRHEDHDGESRGF